MESFYAKKKIKNNSLTLKILFMRPHMRVMVLLISLIATLFSLIIPYYQKEFLDTLLQHKNINELYILLLLMFLYAIMSQFFYFLAKILSSNEGSVVQDFLSGITYSKTLRIKNENTKKITVGHALSVYATDVNTASSLIDDIFPNFIAYFLPLLLAPFAIIYITNIDPITIIYFTFVVLFLNFLIAIRQSKIFIKSKILSAIRIGNVNEWLINIRAIRVLGNTDWMENKIKYARIQETKNRLLMVTNGTTMSSIGNVTPYIINIFALYLLYKIYGDKVTSGQIFSLLWIFGVLLTRPIRMIPLMFVTFFDCYTSIKRVENYWNQDLEEKFIENNDQVNNGLIKIRGLTYENEGKILLNNINIDIKDKEFIAIVGELGSGKTLFLKALLNIINSSFKIYEIGNKSVNMLPLSTLRSYFSYVPQEYFIINSNIRNNVAFEYDFYKEIDDEIINSLELAQFYMNKENVSNGLDTEIGERGVSLSGGQKQRIAIARASFSNRPIILLDDCLSAVDINTEYKINKTLLNGFWKNKTRILVTHRLSVIQKCDKIVFFKDGKIIDIGNYEELMKKSLEFKEFVVINSIKD
ncbi:MAG: ABC transporter ATP-binding protein [Spirobacillus cienkowskii]|uniref:ABC transporter ATP-binding protein n=2 Tax=Spirobacillus cienkowskii TaxID=495820 RepID=A0A369KT39_9BACT|nr:MAG: ABC transporter ATP-binding protein [Spirobacillus cienkowskii]